MRVLSGGKTLDMQLARVQFVVPYVLFCFSPLASNNSDKHVRIEVYEIALVLSKLRFLWDSCGRSEGSAL